MAHKRLSETKENNDFFRPYSLVLSMRPNIDFLLLLLIQSLKILVFIYEILNFSPLSNFYLHVDKLFLRSIHPRPLLKIRNRFIFRDYHQVCFLLWIKRFKF